MKSEKLRCIYFVFMSSLSLVSNDLCVEDVRCTCVDVLGLDVQVVSNFKSHTGLCHNALENVTSSGKFHFNSLCYFFAFHSCT